MLYLCIRFRSETGGSLEKEFFERFTQTEKQYKKQVAECNVSHLGREEETVKYYLDSRSVTVKQNP